MPVHDIEDGGPSASYSMKSFASNRPTARWNMDFDSIGKVCSLRFAPCMPEAERVVALGFRYWMLGLSTSDIGLWERTWSLYSGLFGATGAREAVGCLSKLVGAVDACACRDVEVFPECCRSFCRDECVAVSLIAACQHDAAAAARVSAYALIETSTVEQVLENGQALAASLLSLEHRLSFHSIVAAVGCLHVPNQLAH